MITLTAYHGTSKKNATRILQEGFINDVDFTETKPGLARYPNDLGRGVYGYVEDGFYKGVDYLKSAQENAYNFALKIRKVQPDNIVVLEMKISVSEDKILNVNSREVRNDLVRLYRKFQGPAIQDIQNKYIVDRLSRRKYVDGVILECLFAAKAVSLPDIVLLETHTRFDGYLSHIANGNEVAIRSPKSIVSIKALESRIGGLE